MSKNEPSYTISYYVLVGTRVVTRSTKTLGADKKSVRQARRALKPHEALVAVRDDLQGHANSPHVIRAFGSKHIENALRSAGIV